MIHVYIPREPPEDVRDEFLKLLHEALVIHWGSKIPSPAEFEILVAGRPDEQQLSVSPKLKKLVIPFAGIPLDVLHSMEKFPGIDVHNLHHNAAATAETALSLLFAAAKQTIVYDQALRSGDWSLRYQPSTSVLLHGKTVLVIGYGNIGRIIASCCRALGMNVLATRKSTQSPTSPLPGITIFPASRLGDLLPLTQVLIICTPLTSETVGLIGQAELNLLPQGSILINIARGQVVDEGALYRALTSDRLSAAGLDVWWNYPTSEQARTSTYPSQYPFHKLANVVLSPHRGGATRESDQLRFKQLAELLNQYARREPISNQVDLEKGY